MDPAVPMLADRLISGNSQVGHIGQLCLPDAAAQAANRSKRAGDNRQ
jgi:hypothetical protein